MNKDNLNPNYEYPIEDIEPLYKSELARQELCSVSTIRRRLKKVGVANRNKLLKVQELKLYYDEFGKTETNH